MSVLSADAPPAPAPNVCQDSVEKMLNGLATVGRLFRVVFTTSSSCVKRTLYPMKESFVKKWDDWKGGFDAHGSRTQQQEQTVVYFHGEGEESEDASKSESSR